MKRREAYHIIGRICDDFGFTKEEREALRMAQDDIEFVDLMPDNMTPVVRCKDCKGCPWCEEDAEGYVRKAGAYSIHNGMLMTGHCKPMGIKYCPMATKSVIENWNMSASSVFCGYMKIHNL